MLCCGTLHVLLLEANVGVKEVKCRLLLRFLLRHHLWNACAWGRVSCQNITLSVCEGQRVRVGLIVPLCLASSTRAHTVQCGVHNTCGGEQTQYVVWQAAL